MPLPIVAVVGRPNVGKSTFVNRIAQADEAIVHEMRGVTRDRSYHEAEWNGLSFTLIDTGGIEMGMDDAFQGSIRSQAFSATREADLILFLVDGKTGINVDDEEVARILRRGDKPVLLVVNKMDTPGYTDDMWEFCRLGLGDPTVSAPATFWTRSPTTSASCPTALARTTRATPSTSPSSAARTPGSLP